MNLIKYLRNITGRELIRLFWKFDCCLYPMNSRIVEISFVLTRLGIKRGCIGIFGAAEDRLVPYLCSLGFDVIGFDSRYGPDYRFTKRYKNYTHVICDIRGLPLKFKNEFDAIICISTLEHCVGDEKYVMEQIRLAAKNRIFITVPFGEPRIDYTYKDAPYRIFSFTEIVKLVNDASFELVEYLIADGVICLECKK